MQQHSVVWQSGTEWGGGRWWSDDPFATGSVAGVPSRASRELVRGKIPC